MATKKPRKIKDLKARLGKTIAPNTQTDGDVAPPPGIAPPPGVESSAPAAATPSTPGGIVAPPAAIKPANSSPPGLVAPPFAAPASAAPSAAPPSADPFAAASVAPAGPQEVRLVIDDSAVDDSEVGRQNRGRTIALIAITALIGMFIGYGAGSVNADREIHNLAVRDGKDLLDSVRECANQVEEAQRLVDQAMSTARGGPGKAPAVDYEAIAALARIETPFNAATFSRKNYSLFAPTTVDALFEYNNRIDQAWGRIGALNSLTAGEERQEQLNSSATAMQNAGALTGCVVTVEESRYVCNLGYLEVQEGGGVTVRPTQRSRRGVQKQIYAGEGDLSSGDFAILVNNQASLGVLGEQSSLFGTFVADLSALKALIDQTVEVQGRLQNGLGEIATHEEVFTF